ncbi:MAG: sigma factor [Candidatus Brocadiia bacterium]|jgi:hypothetical protein|nr:sigma factor [Candidatus Brocadiia bacterium]
MAGFAHARLQEMEKQLLLSPADVRARHGDRLEELVLALEPGREYAYEFIYFRVTGFRPTTAPVEAYRGSALAADLVLMLEHVSETAPTPAAACPEPVLTVAEVSARLNVTVRTLHRWRRRGLVSRKYLFPDGRVRAGVRKSAVERFVEAHGELVRQSGSFARLSPRERNDLLERARRLVREEGLSLTAAAQRIARETGRAAETVRRTVHALHPGRGRLKPEEKRRVFEAYRAGHSVGALCRRFERSRASIYRIINEARAREQLDPAPAQRQFFVGPEFAEADADARDADARVLIDETGPADEVELIRFRKYNYLKYKADRLRQRINVRRYVPAAVLDEIEAALEAARAIKRKLLAARLPQIIEIARQHAGSLVGLPELIAEGAVHVSEAIDAFDYRRESRFAPYAGWTLRRRFARTVPSENYGPEPPAGAPEDTGQAEETTAMLTLREGLGRALEGLSEDEGQVVRDHFALGEDGEA